MHIFYLFIYFALHRRQALIRGSGGRDTQKDAIVSTQVLMAVSAHCPPSGWCGNLERVWGWGGWWSRQQAVKGSCMVHRSLAQVRAPALSGPAHAGLTSWLGAMASWEWNVECCVCRAPFPASLTAQAHANDQYY